MARYRKIDPRIWNDEKFTSLSIYARMMFMFILTHPNMTFIGAFRASRPGLARELASTQGLDEGLTEGLAEAYEKGFDELLSKALVLHDPKANFVFARNFVKYNLPESLNVCKSFGNAIDYLPECSLLRVAMANAAKIVKENQKVAFFDALPDAFKQAYAEGLAEALPEGMKEDMPYPKNKEQRTKKVITPVGPLADNPPPEADEPPTDEEIAAMCAQSEPADLFNGAVEMVEPPPEEKPKRKRAPLVTFPETLPDEWREASKIARPDVDPQAVFNKLRSRYAPTTSLKTIGNWRKIFLDWIGREYARTPLENSGSARSSAPTRRFAADSYLGPNGERPNYALGIDENFRPIRMPR